MTEPVGIAVVGLGLAGGAMVPAIHAHPNFRLVAAVDPAAELRDSFREKEALPAFADLGQLWAREDVQALYIASPHRFHSEQAIAAARAGRHVIVEKPMALTVRACDQMIAAAATAGVRLVVGHTHGFDPAIGWIAEAVHTHRYGELGMVSAWNYTDFLYRPRLAAELDESKGGGIWYNQIPHQVDIVRTVVGRDVRTVRAIGSRLDPGRPVSGSCAILMEFHGGVASSIVYSGYDQFDTDELYNWFGEGGGSKAAAHGGARRRLAGLSPDDELSARITQYAYGHRDVPSPARHPHFGELVVTCARADLRPRPDGVRVYGSGGAETVPVPLGTWPGRGNVLDELFAGAFLGKEIVHDGEFARETVRVCAAIAASARSGREITLDEWRCEDR